MKVRDAMADTVSCARPQDTIQHVAELMKQEDTGFIPVVEGERVVGVVTDRDIVVRCLAEAHPSPLQEPVDHIMTTEVETVSPDDDLNIAAQKMAGDEIRRLVVVENRKIVGVLSHGNLVQATAGKGPAQEATVGVTEGA
jgi:CBS domain-containing protein